MPPADFRSLAQQSASSVTFLSNVNFWLESGYFDASSHDKWLLHTWSLAVEWQFYLVLPVVLSMLWRARPKRSTVCWAVAMGMVASLAMSVALTPTKPTGSFFMLPTRAWEMLAGGLVFLLASDLTLTARNRQFLELAGLAVLATCTALADSSIAWPGWRAMLPVAGAVLVWVMERVAKWHGVGTKCGRG